MADVVAAKIAAKILALQKEFNENGHIAGPQQNHRGDEVEEDDADSSEEENDDFVDNERERTLFVANLDERVTESLLYELFLQTGPIESVSIPKEKNGRQRSYGFVIFKHTCSPPYAMRLCEGIQLFRKTLILKYKNSTEWPPMEGPILLPVLPDYSRYLAPDMKGFINSSRRRNNHRSYDDTAEISASLLHVGENDWVKGSNGRVVVKEPTKRNHPYSRRSNGNSAPYPSRNDDSYRNNRRSEQRPSSYNRNRF